MVQFLMVLNEPFCPVVVEVKLVADEANAM
jgi:hypothetical protein